MAQYHVPAKNITRRRFIKKCFTAFIGTSIAAGEVKLVAQNSSGFANFINNIITAFFPSKHLHSTAKKASKASTPAKTTTPETQPTKKNNPPKTNDPTSPPAQELLHENAAVNTPCQFRPGYSTYACAYFVAAMIRYMTAPGTKNPNSLETIFQEAMGKYAYYNGNDSLETMCKVLDSYSVEYTKLKMGPTTIHQQILDALKMGYVCSLTVTETSIYDLVLHKYPYDWPPTDNHVILVTGRDKDGNYIVHDTACTESGKLRKQPRIYSWEKLNIINCLKVRPKWK